jgi:DNA replication protein DnaC
MSDLTQRLTACLKTLYLSTVRACYGDHAERARRESWCYEQYLAEVLSRECETRQHNRIARLLRESKLPLEKTLQSFDRQRLPRKVDAHLGVLLDGGFTGRHENVLAFGNPGSGKTHLLCAVAQELIQQGQRVLFAPCHQLVQELLVAKREFSLPQRLKRLSRFDAIVIDDIGYVQQSREEMEVLFVLLADCYERTSVLISSNLPFSQWEKIFKDPMTTAAAIDRLVHHSIILELNLDSYRLAHSKRTQGAGGS